jgi:hypothetical protein
VLSPLAVGIGLGVLQLPMQVLGLVIRHGIWFQANLDPPSFFFFFRALWGGAKVQCYAVSQAEPAEAPTTLT